MTIRDQNIAKSVAPSTHLGQTLPSLLYHAAAEYRNPTAFSRWTEDGWLSYSISEFRVAAEETALGLRACGLQPGDRVALYMESDVDFCLVDMGCLMAGLIDVPIYLTHAPETISYVLEHADAHAVIVSDRTKLRDIENVLNTCDSVHTVILIENDPTQGTIELSDRVSVRSLREIRSIGRNKNQSDPLAVREMSDQLAPNDLATIIYTSGTTGRPKGVMLTHENITFNALSCAEGLTGYVPGAKGETLLSFLPLTHVFARTNYYLALARGSSLYFTSPENLVRDMQDVRPTMLISVPRVLEKVYAGIIEKTNAADGLKGKIARWGLSRAQTSHQSNASGRISIRGVIADKLVFKKWRNAFGGRLKFLISGGAALSKEISDVLEAAGLPVLQGYGLTETSPVISFNRPGLNRSGTVGQAISGIEIKIAEDGEILTRGPHVMARYFDDEERTNAVLAADGWFATGDIGELSDDGYLTITDRKKDLFKLSTGKYVTPQPLENKLSASPLIEQAIVVGYQQKFAAALLFPERIALEKLAHRMGFEATGSEATGSETKGFKATGSETKGAKPTDSENRNMDDFLNTPEVIAIYKKLVEQANSGMPHWTTIKRFILIPDEVSVENGLLTPTLKIKRSAVREKYNDVISGMYRDDHDAILVGS